MSSNKKQIGLYWKRLTVAVSLAATTGIFLATASAPVHAQQEAGMLLEEIVVTARRREESLTDVPVAISVVSGDYIEEQGLLDQYDLVAELPSVQYDQTRDRLGARPSIRGVSTTSQDALFQTASVFLDGMPLLGNSGNLKYAGVERVEVLRGPQSTAFGRATFAGAINYVSKDPGDTFESKFDLHTSDLGRNLVGVSLSGPISDTLGFTLNANFDEFEGPDEWVTSEGLPVGGESTDFVTGKLKFAPNDFFDMEVRMSYLRTDDQLTTEGFISGAEQARCSNFTLPSGDLYFQGDFNCDISTSFPSGGQPRNRQPELEFTPGTREFYAVQTYSVLDPRVFTERDRITAEFNFNLDNGSAIQILSSYNDEFLRRWDERDRSDAMASVSFNAAGIPRVRGVSSRANPKGGPEQYLDVRWDSAADGAVRWNVGASMFDYRYKLQVHSQFAGVLLGLEDEGNAGRPFLPGTQNDQASTAIGVYGGLQWDVSDRTTLSFEGRFQQDSITNTDFLSGLSFENVTESFQPRLALTQTLTEDWTLYSQFSSGTNPAGVNTVFASPNVAGSIAAAKAAGYITYDDSTFRAFEEEKLTNFEVGLKGGALDNRLQLTAAVYVMKWEDRLQRANLDWTGSDPDPATGLCADPQCWNDGTNNPDPNDTTVYLDAETTSGGIVIPSEDANLWGVELEGSYFMNANWSLRGFIALNNIEYDGYCAPSPVNTFRYAPTATIADGALFDCVDVSGNRIPQESDETALLNVTYRAPLGGGSWEWVARGGVRYAGRQARDEMNILWYPAATTFQGSINFSNENWDIILFGNNLGNEDSPRSIGFGRDANQGSRRPRNFVVLPRIPREVGARLSYNF